MAPFYGWGSAASRLEPLRGGSLLFTTKFPEIPGTHSEIPGTHRNSWLAKLASETSLNQRAIPIWQGQNDGNCP